MIGIAAMLVVAQDHAMPGMPNMPGMAMPMPAARPTATARSQPKPRRSPKPAPDATSRPLPAHPTGHSMPATDHGRMNHGQMDHGTVDHRVMDHGAMNHDAMAHGQMARDTMGAGASQQADAPAPLGTDLPPGDAPPPPAPLDHLADRFWDPAAMARGRAIMMGRDGGGQRFAQVMVNIAEYAVRSGRDGYRWDGEAWFGGDTRRLVVKSEGDGDIAGTLGSAEVRALYSHAIGPYFNLQGGVRQDIRPAPARTYATVGIAGLAPYWFEVEAAAFLSTHGELLARAEAYYDQRLTQRLILQPRAEFNLSAQRISAIGLGSGLTSADFGLRLRYEIRREFAPYVAVTWERRLGETARLARAQGGEAGGAAVALGIRGWF